MVTLHEGKHYILNNEKVYDIAACHWIFHHVTSATYKIRQLGNQFGQRYQIA